MSHARKHVIESVLNDFPVPSDEETIVRCVALRGGSVCEVEDSEGKSSLVSIPNKFHKTIWISKGTEFGIPFWRVEGDYLIVQGHDFGTKNQGCVVHVLYKEQIKHLKELGKWPVWKNVEERSMSVLGSFGSYKTQQH